MPLDKMIVVAPHLADAVFDLLDMASLKCLLGVDTKVRAATMQYLQTDRGKEKDRRSAVCLSPAVISIPGTEECYYDKVHASVGWDHSKAADLADSPPIIGEVLQVISGDRNLKAQQRRCNTCRLCDDASLSCLCQSKKRGRRGLFGCAVGESHELCAFSADDDKLEWIAESSIDARSADLRCLAACIGKTGSFYIAAPVGCEATIQRFADGRKLAETRVGIDRSAGISIGADGGEIVLVENSVHYCMIQTYDDQSLQFRDYAILRTGKADKENSVNIDITAGQAMQVIQRKGAADLVVYALADLSLTPLRPSKIFRFVRRKFVCGIADLPGSFIIEKRITDLRLYGRELLLLMTPEKKRRMRTTKLYLVTYPRTLDFLWKLQACRGSGKITCLLEKQRFFI